MECLLVLRGKLKHRCLFQCPEVVFCSVSSCRKVSFEVFQLDIQQGSLEGVEPGVAAHHLVVIFHLLSVVGNHPDFHGQLVVVGIDGSAIAEASQVFGGKEGGASDVSDGSCFLRLVV